MRYSAFDRELFACVAGIRHFRYMLEGRPFTIYTDHKPLTFALGKVSEPWTAMQSRQLSYVAEFTTDIRHIPGSENIVADTLSRPPPAALPAAATGGPAVAAVAASPVNLDFARIAANQKSCQETLKAAHSSSLQLQHMDMQGERVLCDISTGQPRPLIPVADRRDVFRAVHELAHAGIRATRRLMAARVVWRGMASDVAAWCRDCQLCARGKASPQHTAPVQPIPVPERRFTHVHVDLVGPLPASTEGFKYLFTMVDRSSRWLEAVPLKSMAAEDCVDVLISAWVARFGVPSIITSDQGRQFTSALWAGLTKLLGIKHVQTTAYHPQSNGMVERAHGQLKAALRARLAGSRWPEHLPWVLLGLRTAPKEDSGVSAFR
jgi:transposase InsO family protein